MKPVSPKWVTVADVDVMKCAITKGRKGQKNSTRVIADAPLRAVHHLSNSGEDGEAQHWIRLFLFDGRQYVHSGYHTRNTKGNVQNGQYASMLPKEEFDALITKAIENEIITLPPQTIRMLIAKNEGPK